MKYTLLALTTLLTLFTALPAKAGRIWIDDPYYRRDQQEVIIRRCFDNDWYYNRPYGVYGCRERVIRRYPYYRNYRNYRVYRRYDDRYRGYDYDFDRYRYHRPGLRIRIGY